MELMETTQEVRLVVSTKAQFMQNLGPTTDANTIEMSAYAY